MLNRIQNLIPILFLLLAQSFNTSTAVAGTKDGNGGNGQVAQFYSLSKAFHKEMKAVYQKVAPDFPMAQLTSVMAALTVEADPGPLTLQNGVKVDAINNPNTGTIYLDDVSWAKRDLKTQYQIVVHELLGLLRLPDNQYEVSNRLAEATKAVIAPAPAAPAPKLWTCDSTFAVNGRYYGGVVVKNYDTEKLARHAVATSCMQQGYHAGICVALSEHADSTICRKK